MLHFAGILAATTLCGLPKQSVGWTNVLPDGKVTCPECLEFLNYGAKGKPKYIPEESPRSKYGDIG